MKLRFLLLLLPVALGGGTTALGAQINWGSPVDSVIRDSFGVPLDYTFVVQLGYFHSVLGTPFVPTADNASEWSTHWKVFDQASVALGTFDPEIGYFTSSAVLQANGSSSGASASTATDFSNQAAYVWIYNSTTPSTETEWFLARAGAWDFPDKPPECCDNLPVLNWSVSDLTVNDVPVYGQQGAIPGAGEHTNTGVYTLQTFTFVPEPSSALLVALGGLTLILRRRRECMRM